MGYQIDWSVLWESPYREWILEGLSLTFQISLVSWVLALVIGILIGMLAESPLRFLQLLSSAHVELFRNVPLLVQLFFAYFVIPLLLPLLRRELYDLGWEMGSAILTLSLYTSAKLAEHVRAGLNTVGKGVRQGALSTGLTWWQMEVFVVVPLLLRIIVPSITSEFLTIFKSSSLAMAVGVMETTSRPADRLQHVSLDRGECHGYLGVPPDRLGRRNLHGRDREARQGPGTASARRSPLT
jgi:glutamate/aspartate transport system permease protein